MKTAPLETKSIFAAILRYYRWYLTSIFLLLFSIPVLLNRLRQQPLVLGPESYYHLLMAKQASWHFYYLPLRELIAIHPAAPIFLSLLVGILSLLIFFLVAKQLGWQDSTTALFCILLILSPSVLLVFTTISSFSYWIFLGVLGLWLLLTSDWRQWLSVVPLLLAALFNLYSTLILLLILLLLFRRRQKIAFVFVILVLLASLLIQWVVWNQPFFIGPFSADKPITSLVSDFGSSGGLSVFFILLTVVGIWGTWKRQEFMPTFLLILLIPGYIYSPRTLFLLTLPAAFLAARGLQHWFAQSWKLSDLQKFAFFLITLGLIFSTLSYLNRLPNVGPTAAEAEALEWIRDNTPASSLILSFPENNYYIRYFADREPLYLQHQQTVPSEQKMFHAVYISELFPLLEQQHINYIYLTPEMREQLPQDYGFLFLLKNERFKIVHWYQDHEVWLFKSAS